MWLDFSLEVLLNVAQARDVVEFEIQWTSEDEMHAFSELLLRKCAHGLLFAEMDGGRMTCAAYNSSELHNYLLERFTQETEVSDIYVWNFFGELVHAGVHFPER